MRCGGHCSLVFLFAGAGMMRDLSCGRQAFFILNRSSFFSCSYSSFLCECVTVVRRVRRGRSSERMGAHLCVCGGEFYVD